MRYGRIVPDEIYTVGHSNLAEAEFLDLLTHHEIRHLVDVRAFPSSRRHPHFNRESLAASCAARGIEYHWLRELGGRRKPSESSPHVAWQVAALRAYADYAETPEFAAALASLEEIARRDRTAVMCAEARWWQCHRRLISDRLTVEGWRVRHILGTAAPAVHELPDIARVVDGRIVYDVGTNRELDFSS